MWEKLKSSESHYKLLEEKNSEHLAQLQKGYEEKVSILLHQLRGVEMESKSPDVKHKSVTSVFVMIIFLDISGEEELRQMCSIQHEKIEDQEKKIKDLEEKIETIQVSIFVYSVIQS